MAPPPHVGAGFHWWSEITRIEQPAETFIIVVGFMGDGMTTGLVANGRWRRGSDIAVSVFAKARFCENLAEARTTCKMSTTSREEFFVGKAKVASRPVMSASVVIAIRIPVIFAMR